MDGLTIARALHVLAIVHWIGGVTMVTLVLLPGLLRDVHADRRMGVFELIEGLFARQARISTLIAGATGLYMIDALGAWDRFLDMKFWWIDAMVLVWAAFSFALFLAEPLFLNRWFREAAARSPDSAFLLAWRLHLILLAVSLATVAAGVLGAHGAL